ncbi:MAG TPA: 4Fe-4S dicluster domain-containing protein [Solirubrobacteraceae bacterium]
MSTATHVVERIDFDALLDALKRRGYTIVGPTVRDQAIVYDEIARAEDLPIGWTDEQEAGRYRLRRRDDEALFGYAVGPHSWKQYQLPAEVKLWRARVDGDGGLSDLTEPPRATPRYAFFGARSCELHAIGILDRVLLGGSHPDPADRGRTKDLFVVAVQCGQAGGTCFCVSMNTGPVAERGFDLALTEVLEDVATPNGPDTAPGTEPLTAVATPNERDTAAGTKSLTAVATPNERDTAPGTEPLTARRHYFVVEVGSERGADVMAEVPHSQAAHGERDAAGAVHARTASQMGRELDVTGIQELLYRNFDNARWDEVAERCLTCGNCTMVCPTCFCTTVEDVTDLEGDHVERTQRWDSCFTVDYSGIHGGAVRGSAKARYRQWMTHKLATWHDQFGTSGCVGCGRCITWCPVGIDLTEEAAAIRASEGGDDERAR